MNTGTFVVTDDGTGFYYGDKLIWKGDGFPVEPIAWFTGSTFDSNQFLHDPGPPPEDRVVLDWRRSTTLHNSLDEFDELPKCVSDVLVNECVEDWHILCGKRVDLQVRLCYLSATAASIAADELIRSSEVAVERWSEFMETHGDFLSSEQYARIMIASQMWTDVVNHVDKNESVV